MIDSARENTDTARSLQIFILVGTRTGQQIRRIDDMSTNLASTSVTEIGDTIAASKTGV